VKTLLQTFSIKDPNRPAPVDVRKQRTAFPPNFIHSLDASQMMMTAISCHSKNLTFASVHDSYWTHACDVDAMNEVIREEFVALHSQPIMENLMQAFEKRYNGYMIPYEVVKQKNAKESKNAHLKGINDQKLEPSNIESAASLAGDIEAEGNVVPIPKVSKRSWVPLKLPPLPKRGGFNVQEIIKSSYFFH
jgi:DNA-directed RNA polymerase